MTRKRAVDSRISGLQDKIAAARAKEQRLSSEIADVTARIRTLESEVGDVSTDLALLEQDLALQRERLARITELWRLQTAKLGFLRSQHEQAIDRLSDRIVAIYQSGNLSTVDVLLNSSNFSELVTRLDYAQELAAQDERIAESVGQAKDRIQVQQKNTTLREEDLRLAHAVAARTEQTARFETSSLPARPRPPERERNAVRPLSPCSSRRGVPPRGQVAPGGEERVARLADPESQSSSSVVRSARGSCGRDRPGDERVRWRWGRMHEGIDIAVPTGTPVVASASGQVIVAGWMGGYGNLVVIDHGGGIATAYGHNSSFAVGAGSTVSQGQTIAYAGSTGNSTGPHEHSEVRVNEWPVDPLGYLG